MSWRTTATGHWAAVMTAWLTEPSTSPVKPPRPLLPTTTRPAPPDAWPRLGPGWPETTSAETARCGWLSCTHATASPAGGCQAHRTRSGARAAAATLAANSSAACDVVEPSTPTTTGWYGPGWASASPRTTTTGQYAWAVTANENEPSTADVAGPRPRLPTTTSEADSEACTRAPAAPPTTACVVMLSSGYWSAACEAPLATTSSASVKSCSEIIDALCTAPGETAGWSIA